MLFTFNGLKNINIHIFICNSASLVSSARNGNLEVPVYVLKAKQGYTVRKMEKYIWMVVYIDKCRYEIQEQKEVPVWYTGPFRELLVSDMIKVMSGSRN
jgi:uncharacterized membrane-anchored protein YitT (DUF2179 family)